MLRHLETEDAISRTNISNYELGDREPPLYILLEYARVANVFVDALIDDGLDLPKILPARFKSEGVMRPKETGTKKRQ